MAEWWQQPENENDPENTPKEQDRFIPEEEPIFPPAEPTPSVPESEPTPEPTEAPAPSDNGWQFPPAHTPQSGVTYRWDPQQRPSFTPTPPPPPQTPKKNGVLIALVAILSVLCILCMSVTAVVLVNHGKLPTEQDTPSDPTTPTTRPENPSGPTMDFTDDEDDGGMTTADIAEKCIDSTVVITVYTNTKSRNYGGFIIGSDGEQQAGSASGIIWSADGYIITNQHVCVNANTNQPYDRIEVRLYNGAVYDATLVGADGDTDLAVIKIEATGLKAAEFGDSDKARVGDRVITIGNSGSLPWSVSQGVLSGKDRDVYDQTGYEIRCLQVDANINPGNSGGPLVNNQGKVIGINSAKIVYEGYENLGFSIPITEARPVLEDLVRYGYVTGRTELGITGYNISDADFAGGGFMIDTIVETSCLKGTAIQQYDIITHINGTRVANRNELRNELSKYKVGETVSITVTRILNSRTGESKELKVDVKLKEIQQ